ncbi:MAG TPA: hypothetical protein VGO26_02865 [Amnibacterium sp.]|jgi:hypothetical protein|nr:hypothetical protein [Amnibacterium sp.]
MRTRTALRRTAPLVAVTFASVVLLLLAGCSAVALLRAPAAPPPTPTERAGSTDDTGSAAYQRRQALQERVDRYLHWLGAQPRIHAEGYIDGVADGQHLTATLLWYGDDAYRAVAVSAGPRFGVTVRIQQRPQSLAQFIAAQHRVAAARDRLAALGFRLRVVDGIGALPAPLTISGTFDPFADRAAVRRLATRAAGQPVRVEADTGALPGPAFFGPFPIRFGLDPGWR